MDLTETPEPQSIRMRSTPPSGSLLLRREVERLSEDPKDAEIRDLRMTNVLYRERLAAVQASMPNTAPSLTPEAPKSRAAIAGKLTLNLGKYTALVVGVLGIAAQIAHIWRPDLEGPLQTLLKWVGQP